MADNLNDSMNSLEQAFRQYSTKFARFTRGLDKLDSPKDISNLMTRLIAVGREDILTTNSLSREFRMTGLSLKESFGLFHTNIATGFKQYDTGSKRLLSTVVKLGLGERLFSDMLAFNTEVLQQNVKGSTALADHIVSMGHRFNIDANALVNQLKSLDDTTRRVSLQSGGNASMNLQRVATTVGAALGPQYLAGMSELVGLVAGTTIKDYTTASRFGGTGGIGRDDSSKNILAKFKEMSLSIEDVAGSMGAFNSSAPPWMASMVADKLGTSKELLQLVRKFNRTQDVGDSLADEIADRLGADQLRYDISRNLTKVTASLQSVILPYALDFTKFLAENAGEMAHFVDDSLTYVKEKFEEYDVQERFRHLFKNLSGYFKIGLEVFNVGFKNFNDYVIPKAIDSFGDVKRFGMAGTQWFKDFGNSSLSDYLTGKISFIDLLYGDSVASKKEDKYEKARMRERLNPTMSFSPPPLKLDLGPGREKEQVITDALYNSALQRYNEASEKAELQREEHLEEVRKQTLAAEAMLKVINSNSFRTLQTQSSINSIGSFGVFSE